ncbi:MAG: ATP-dependent helicase UvrD/PcrA [Candidatus Cloacimonadota bacterium]|nr:ATP-dependent helicase UvrD/PcrA [Candidatus Cloacimonadota bacterium]MDK2851200.1 ATP-dependent helicase UvrD/PcrA [Candidatus Cloacimonadota bacterium]
MPWYNNLLDNQREAASCDCDRVVLLAGPGTGKTLTLTRRVCYLLEVQNVDPRNICVITFSRAAAAELRTRITKELGETSIPKTSTLHSFALSQLLRLTKYNNNLPMPIRIADDWEERYIVLEDLKRQLSIPKVSDVNDLLNQMSSDWQSLTADEQEWENRFPNPRFIGAWREHRQVYAYTLRSELVYQLKHTIQQNPQIIDNIGFGYLLVDEYQDLNRCDLAVIKFLSEAGIRLFVSGDDDQSIYGFRKAHPMGIRRFTVDYQQSESKNLNICKRCDQNILDFSLFVARQDPLRLDKVIVSDSTRTADIRVLRFDNQISEAEGISRLCSYLINHEGIQAHDILILLRSNKNNCFSNIIANSLLDHGISVKTQETESSVFDDTGGRRLLSYLRLIVNPTDELSMRSIIQTTQGIGAGAIDAIYRICQERNVRFCQSLVLIAQQPSILTRWGNRIKLAFESIHVNLARYNQLYDPSCITTAELQNLISIICIDLDLQETEQVQILNWFQNYIDASDDDLLRIDDILREKDTSLENAEVVFEKGKVHIMSMHKAKGLTAEAVIIPACEDEHIPGRNTEIESMKEEMRLLYVSLTRAKHYLYLTYCNRRTDSQCYAGSNLGRTQRTLSRFLADAPVSPTDGTQFTRSLPN